jgi:hypothetical protein
MMTDVKSKYKQNNNNHDETTEDLEHGDAHGNGTTFDGVLLPCRSCSRSVIDTLQRHTLHLQVREASWLSLNRSIAGNIDN